MYDIDLYSQDIEVNVTEEMQNSEMNLGCEIYLPPPYDITILEEIQIELLPSITYEEYQGTTVNKF